MIAGEMLFMRSESRAREHSRRREETTAPPWVQQKQYVATMVSLDVQRRTLETLIERTSTP